MTTLSNARRIARHAKDFVSAADYYDIADGADDTASFTRALATGKRVFAPAGRGHGPSGEYLLDHLTLVSNAFIFGDGAATVIRPKTAADSTGSVSAAIYYQAPDNVTQITDVVLRDLTLYGRVETNAFWEFNHLVHVGGVRRMLVDNVTFKGFQGDGLTIAAGEAGGERHNYDVTVRNCTFDGINRDNRNGISVIDVTRMLVTGCKFVNCSRSNMPGPIDLEPDNFSYYVVRDVSVVDCVFDSNGGNVAQVGYFSGANPVLPVGFTVRNCRFSNYVGTGAAMAFNNGRLSNTDATLPSHVRFVNNTVIGAGQPFAVYTGRGITIEGNDFQGCTGGGLIGYTLSTLAYANPRDVVVRNNRFRGCMPSGGHTLAISAVDDLTIEGNEFLDCGNGTGGSTSTCAYFIDGNTGARHTWARNRIVMGAARSITGILGSAYNFTASGNRFEGNTAGYLYQFPAYDSDVDQAYTPIVEGSASAGVGTYTRRNGKFRKRGNRVYFEVQIDFTAHTGTGLMMIGLPPIPATYVDDADIIPLITRVSGAGMAYTAGEVPIAQIHTYATTSISTGAIRMWKMTPSGSLGQITIPASSVCSLTLKGDYAC